MCFADFPLTHSLPRLLRLARRAARPLGFALPVLAALPAASAAATPPNVLLIVSDDLTARALGSYGNAVCRTPHLDRLAREGVRFTSAYCQFPVCGPSRASFMSGLYPEHTGMLNNSYVTGAYRPPGSPYANHPSIGGFLRRHGYVSLRVSKIYHMGIPGSIESGDAAGDEPDSWDRAFNIMAPETASFGEFTHLSPKRTDFGTAFTRIIVPDAEEKTQADTLAVNQAVAILQARARARGQGDRRALRPGAPFFLAVGLVRPHVPSVAPQRLFDHYPADRIELPEVPANDLADVPAPAQAMRNDLRYGMDESQQRQAIAAYYATVEFMDEQVGRLLAELERLDLRRNTVVVFISDHGFHLGEHTLWQKTTLFEESVGVPLLISAPGFEASRGAACAALVELTDLYPTLADLAGLGAEAPRHLPGRSLRPLLENPRQAGLRDTAYSITNDGGRSLRTARWRYNRWSGGGEELYDLARDPRQFTNLAAVPEHAATLAELRTALDQHQARIAAEKASHRP